eukprot:TRINITY_DN9035_c0_g1_i1.p1 TRINITY_DN9035_c0_g1~~TRINITY_DN9035_c0_g1_i1.p1  ORF type:complete len:405 (+),score=68.00 TRINITY_DN9035_c0_g1_i1:365-1579(+)
MSTYKNSKPSQLVVALAGCHQGQKKEGVDNGWMACVGHVSYEDAVFVDFRDSKYFQDPVRGTCLLSRNIRDAIRQNKADDRDSVLLTLGGDHTVSLGSVMASRQVNPETRLIWIDAHPDINTPFTTLTGNCHGCPVAYLAGLVDGFRLEPGCPPLRPDQICYIGLRSIDDAEEEIIQRFEKQGLIRFCAEEILSSPDQMFDIIAKIEKAWGASHTRAEKFSFPIHVSLDVDSMDPEFTPATGTPVPRGLHPDHVQQLIHWANIMSSCGAHLDVMEVNPMLSSAKGAARTVGVTQRVIKAWYASHPNLPVEVTPMPVQTKTLSSVCLVDDHHHRRVIDTLGLMHSGFAPNPKRLLCLSGDRPRHFFSDASSTVQKGRPELIGFDSEAIHRSLLSRALHQLSASVG